ncbi:MAG: hypothetical protein MZV64_65435 [Ignavibacteriales bacterium]|nr:hypothetical protein [Ignavibacteriales bacterium]
MTTIYQRVFQPDFVWKLINHANTGSNKISVFVKDAYLQWKNIFKGSDLIFGIHPTPAYEISEGIWGNRFLEKTIMDLRGIVSSRDLGASLKGKFSEEGIFKYWVDGWK